MFVSFCFSPSCSRWVQTSLETPPKPEGHHRRVARRVPVGKIVYKHLISLIWISLHFYGLFCLCFFLYTQYFTLRTTINYTFIERGPKTKRKLPALETSPAKTTRMLIWLHFYLSSTMASFSVVINGWRVWVWRSHRWLPSRQCCQHLIIF